ncbi:MAG: hypothetical protein ASARMPRED_001602 [Alectoria sarmentosa]|nr:MAG: hypothetical protein ASARMPRED_001602 [Alectoria sarmentosa]
MLAEIFRQIGSSAVQSWWYILEAFVAMVICQDAFFACSMYWRRPRQIPIHGPSLVFGKWWSSLWFILKAPQLIVEGYKQSQSNLFAIPAREGYLVMVTSEDQIREVENSSPDQLSFHQAMEDRLKVKYIFAGFEMGAIDPHDAVPIRVLKTLLRANIPELRSRIQEAIEGTFETSANQDFFQATRKYHRQALVAMLSSHYLPHWTDKIVVPGILALGRAMKTLTSYLTLEVEQRLHYMIEGKKDVPRDAITWVIEASTTKDQRAVKRIVQQKDSTNMQLPKLLMFSIYRLCEHPEYTKLLLNETEAMLKLPTKDHYKHLPLMESFLREAARHDPLDSLSVQRKVLKDFKFSDGSHVPAGNVICVPQQAVMRDPKYYDRPDDFLPSRFVSEHGDGQDDGAIQKFTDLKPHFYLWGAAAKPCPGRWYASAVMQQFFVHLLTRYNFKLADPNASLTLTYTTIVFPRPGLKILLQERQ